MSQANINITPNQMNENKEEDPDSDQSRQENNNSQSQDSQVDKAEVLWKLIRNAAYLFAYFTLSVKVLGAFKQYKYKFIWNVYEHVKK